MSFLKRLFGPPDVDQLATDHNIEGLIKALGYAKDEGVRTRAVAALGAMGASAVQPLSAALHDSDNHVRHNAAAALSLTGASAVETLIAALQDSSANLRYDAAWALGRIGDARALEPLRSALGDSKEIVRVRAAEVLSRMDDPRAVEPLLAYRVQHGEGGDWAAEAVRKMGKAAVEPLIAVLEHSPRYVMGAAWLLGDVGDACAVEPLIAALQGGDEGVRENTAWALGRIADARAAEPLIAALHDGVEVVRRNAAVALGRIADARAVAPLIAALQDASPVVRFRAAEALGLVGDARALAPLTAALQDGSGDVRKLAAEALGKIEAAQSSRSPGRLLDVYLSAMPPATQAQQKARFAGVATNLEFGLFVPLPAAERLAGEAMQRGLTVWENTDATSAFLYGAGAVGPDEFTQVMTWLRDAATPGQKIQVAIHTAGEPMKLVETAV